MFQRVSGAPSVLQRLVFTGCCCRRVYRRSPAVSVRHILLEDHAGGWRTAVLSVTGCRGFTSDTNTGKLRPLLSVRSSFVMQPRRSLTTPEKHERAADIRSDGVSSAADGSELKASKVQQLRQVFQQYGAVGVSFHICISLISLGIFYLAVSSGLDVASLLCKLGFSEAVVQSRLAAGTSVFVLAYAVHKLFAPLRISITLVCVPLIVRHLRRTGLFRSRTSGP
uniref:Zgc:112435 n=1 Tax=Danio rerio TaxID=7955 RepID=Q4V9H6_DANRE|nr:Zgc:112435 [Danio rerio]|eukprot:NP_001028923.1 protein FAM210B [Danio rerio]